MSKSDEQKSATLKLEAVNLQTEATETRATKSHGRAHPTAAAQSPSLSERKHGGSVAGEDVTGEKETRRGGALAGELGRAQP
jgi:hypothetical protein